MASNYNANVSVNFKINSGSSKAVVNAFTRQLASQKLNIPVNLKFKTVNVQTVSRQNTAFRALNNTIKQLGISSSKSAAQLNTLYNVVRHVNSGLNNFGSSRGLQSFNSNVGKAAVGIKNIGNQFKQANHNVIGFSESVGISARRFLSFGVAAAVLAKASYEIRNATVAAVQFDHEMVRLEQTSRDTETVIASIAKTISKLGVNMGVDSAQMAKTAVTLRQAGLSAMETSRALTILGKTSLSPSFEDLHSTTEGLIALFNQFDKNIDNLEKHFSAISKVSADFAVESSDLVEALKRTGGAFKAAGGNVNELLAMYTTIRQTTRESAESIATGMRTILARLEDPAIAKKLKNIGVEVYDLKGQFVGPYEAVERLSEALKKLPQGDIRASSILKDIGGLRQLSRVIPLVYNNDVTKQALESARNSAGRLDEDAKIAQKSMVIQLSRIKEGFLDLFRVISTDSSVRAALTGIASAIEAIGSALREIKPLVPILLAFGTIKAAGAVVSGFSSFRRGFTAPVKGYSQGGWVTGGTPGKDSVPAMLMPGEYVVPAKQARHFAKGGKIDFSIHPDKALRFYNIQRNKYYKNLEPDLLKQLESYRTYPHINRLLIQNPKLNTNTTQKLDTSIDRGIVKADTRVYRGIQDQDIFTQARNKGDIIHVPQYVSTSISSRYARNFGKVVGIDLPKGLKSAYIKPGGGVTSDEYEMLLGRNQHFVLHDYQDDMPIFKPLKLARGGIIKSSLNRKDYRYERNMLAGLFKGEGGKKVYRHLQDVNAKFLDAGAEAAVFKNDQNRVFRIANIHNRPRRVDSELMLQALEERKFGQGNSTRFLEELPFTPPLDKTIKPIPYDRFNRKAYEESKAKVERRQDWISEAFAKRVISQGYLAKDVHAGNLARVNKKIVAIDPTTFVEKQQQLNNNRKNFLKALGFAEGGIIPAKGGRLAKKSKFSGKYYLLEDMMVSGGRKQPSGSIGQRTRLRRVEIDPETGTFTPRARWYAAHRQSRFLKKFADGGMVEGYRGVGKDELRELARIHREGGGYTSPNYSRVYFAVDEMGGIHGDLRSDPKRSKRNVISPKDYASIYANSRDGKGYLLNLQVPENSTIGSKYFGENSVPKMLRQYVKTITRSTVNEEGEHKLGKAIDKDRFISRYNRMFHGKKPKGFARGGQVFSPHFEQLESRFLETPLKPGKTGVAFSPLQKLVKITMGQRPPMVQGGKMFKGKIKGFVDGGLVRGYRGVSDDEVRQLTYSQRAKSSYTSPTYNKIFIANDKKYAERYAFNRAAENKNKKSYLLNVEVPEDKTKTFFTNNGDWMEKTVPSLKYYDVKTIRRLRVNGPDNPPTIGKERDAQKFISRYNKMFYKQKPKGYAQGGSIFQPQGTDTVPAMLTPGEFVIPKAAAQKFGYDNLEKIRSGAFDADTIGRLKSRELIAERRKRRYNVESLYGNDEYKSLAEHLSHAVLYQRKTTRRLQGDYRIQTSPNFFTRRNIAFKRYLRNLINEHEYKGVLPPLKQRRNLATGGEVGATAAYAYMSGGGVVPSLLGKLQNIVSGKSNQIDINQLQEILDKAGVNIRASEHITGIKYQKRIRRDGQELGGYFDPKERKLVLSKRAGIQHALHEFFHAVDYRNGKYLSEQKGSKNYKIAQQYQNLGHTFQKSLIGEEGLAAYPESDYNIESYANAASAAVLKKALPAKELRKVAPELYERGKSGEFRGLFQAVNNQVKSVSPATQNSSPPNKPPRKPPAPPATPAFGPRPDRDYYKKKPTELVDKSGMSTQFPGEESLPIIQGLKDRDRQREINQLQDKNFQPFNPYNNPIATKKQLSEPHIIQSKPVENSGIIVTSGNSRGKIVASPDPKEFQEQQRRRELEARQFLRPGKPVTHQDIVPKYLQNKQTKKEIEARNFLTPEVPYSNLPFQGVSASRKNYVAELAHRKRVASAREFLTPTSNFTDLQNQGKFPTAKQNVYAQKRLTKSNPQQYLPTLDKSGLPIIGASFTPSKLGYANSKVPIIQSAPAPQLPVIKSAPPQPNNLINVGNSSLIGSSIINPPSMKNPPSYPPRPSSYPPRKPPYKFPKLNVIEKPDDYISPSDYAQGEKLLDFAKFEERRKKALEVIKRSRDADKKLIEQTQKEYGNVHFDKNNLTKDLNKTFKYKGIDAQGNKVSGVAQGLRPDQVAQNLARQGIQSAKISRSVLSDINSATHGLSEVDKATTNKLFPSFSKWVKKLKGNAKKTQEQVENFQMPDLSGPSAVPQGSYEKHMRSQERRFHASAALFTAGVIAPTATSAIFGDAFHPGYGGRQGARFGSILGGGLAGGLTSTAAVLQSPLGKNPYAIGAAAIGGTVAGAYGSNKQYNQDLIAKTISDMDETLSKINYNQKTGAFATNEDKELFGEGINKLIPYEEAQKVRSTNLGYFGSIKEAYKSQGGVASGLGAAVTTGLGYGFGATSVNPENGSNLVNGLDEERKKTLSEKAFNLYKQVRQGNSRLSHDEAMNVVNEGFSRNKYGVTADQALQGNADNVKALVAFDKGLDAVTTTQKTFNDMLSHSNQTLSATVAELEKFTQGMQVNTEQFAKRQHYSEMAAAPLQGQIMAAPNDINLGALGGPNTLPGSLHAFSKAGGGYDQAKQKLLQLLETEGTRKIADLKPEDIEGRDNRIATAIGSKFGESGVAGSFTKEIGEHIQGTLGNVQDLQDKIRNNPGALADQLLEKYHPLKESGQAATKQLQEGYGIEQQRQVNLANRQFTLNQQAAEHNVNIGEFNASRAARRELENPDQSLRSNIVGLRVNKDSARAQVYLNRLQSGQRMSKSLQRFGRRGSFVALREESVASPEERALAASTAEHEKAFQTARGQFKGADRNIGELKAGIHDKQGKLDILMAQRNAVSNGPSLEAVEAITKKINDIAKNNIAEGRRAPFMDPRIQKLEKQRESLYTNTGADKLKGLDQQILATQSTMRDYNEQLKLLANNTHALEDAQKKYELAQQRVTGDLEAHKKDADVLAFGSRKEKMGLMMKENITQQALSLGHEEFANLPDQIKKIVFERLQETQGMNRQIQTYDKYGRENGVRNINGEEALNQIRSPYLNYLQNQAPSRYLRNQRDQAATKLDRTTNDKIASGSAQLGLQQESINKQAVQGEDSYQKFLQGINQSIAQQMEASARFIEQSAELTKALNGFNGKLSIERNGKIEVVLNGVGVLQAMKGDLEAEIMQTITKKLEEIKKQPAR